MQDCLRERPAGIEVRRLIGMKYKKSVYRSLAMVTQLGFCVLTPVFLGIFAGSYLDSRYGTHLTLVFLILGVLGGGRGAYAMAKRLIDQDAKEARIEKEEHWKKALSDGEGGVDRPKPQSRIFKPESEHNQKGEMS